MFKVFTVRLKIVYNFGFSGCNMVKESLSLLAHKKLFPANMAVIFRTVHLKLNISLTNYIVSSEERAQMYKCLRSLSERKVSNHTSND